MDELNFRRFQEIFPVYRDMGRTCKAAFEKAKSIDLFNEKPLKECREKILTKAIEIVKTAPNTSVAIHKLVEFVYMKEGE